MKNGKGMFGLHMNKLRFLFLFSLFFLLSCTNDDSEKPYVYQDQAGKYRIEYEDPVKVEQYKKRIEELNNEYE